MDRNLTSFFDGYSKAIRLFPDIDENTYTDWENIGRDIEVSIINYTKEMDKESCQNQMKNEWLMMRYKRLKKKTEALKQ